MRLFRITKTLVFALLLVVSLSLNIATVAIGSVAMMVSGVFEAVTGAASVVGGLRRDDAQKSARIASLSREIDAKDLKLARMSDEVATLRKPRTVSYRGQQRLLGEAVSDTSTRVSRRMATAAARNAGSVAAEAIPIAGIAVIVAVTAWDIHDSCETMKDLHALDLAFNPQADRDPEITEVCGMTVPTRDEVWAAVRSSPGAAWDMAQQYVPDLPVFEMPPVNWPFRDWSPSWR